MILVVSISHRNSCFILFRIRSFSLFCLTVHLCSFYHLNFRKWPFSTTVGHYMRDKQACKSCPHLWKIYNQGRIIKGGEWGGRPAHPFWEMPWGPPTESIALGFCIVLLNTLLITLEPRLISSEASHMFVKINQNFCANMPKGAPQQFKCVENEHFKTKWLQTIYSAECTFTQKQIPRQNEKFTLVSTNKVSV